MKKQETLVTDTLMYGTPTMISIKLALLGIVDDFQGIISLSSSSILCNAFLVEAKWFVVGHVPKTDDYLKNGIISSGVHVVLVHMFFLLGHGITKRNVGIVDDFRGIISFAATILRLWDDLGSAKVILKTSLCSLAPHDHFLF